MKVIDGENCILGRLSAEVSKDLLKGEEVRIVNAEKVIVTGDPVMIMRKYKGRRDLRDLGNPNKSPKFPRRPDLFVKRTVRGMLPWNSKKGREAYRRLKAYIGVPEEFAGKGVKVCELKNPKVRTISIENVCRELGWSSG